MAITKRGLSAHFSGFKLATSSILHDYHLNHISQALRLSILLSYMLLHLAATLPQSFFPAIQEARFIDLRHNPWRLVCQNGADFS